VENSRRRLALIDTTEPRPQSAPLILGRSKDQELLTLYGCIQTNTTMGIEGVRETWFFVIAALIGATFQSFESIAFGVLEATFPELIDWVGISGVVSSIPTKETLVITKQNSPLVVASVHNAKFSIGFKFKEHHGNREVSVKYVPYISIEITDEIPLKDFLELLYHVRNFLALAVGHSIYPDSISLLTQNVKAVLPDGTPFRTPIELVFHNVNWGVPHEAVNIRGMLFELNKVQHRFESVLTNWLDKVELLEPIHSMYFGTLYNPNMFLHQKFLSLVLCLESYHRRRGHNLELPPEEGKKRVDDIVNVAPEQHRKWLKNKLRYSNELTLRRRLKELVESFSFVEVGNQGQFIEDVVNTRNYHIHYDEELKKLSADPTKMSMLALRLAALTEAILLVEIGLTLDEVKLITQRIKQRQSELRSFDF
jgi:hypothetical protein